ncbi:hypothetical protein JCM33374_g4735 [Metschnikowia sp. JCM 33374]|nr:hypothetical protein JCM33374_g4735 [Metschnikowia sp. JCM 33374]
MVKKKTQKDIEIQYSRLKDVQSVDTTLWAKIAELEIVQQKVRDVSQMLKNSETLLRHQKFWHEIDDKKTSDANLVIDKNGNGSYLANVGVFPSGVADLPSGIA